MTAKDPPLFGSGASGGKDVESTDWAESEESEEESSEELALEPGLEWWQATFSLAVVTIGVGILALPHLPQRGGMVATAATTFVCGFTIYEAGLAIWEGIMLSNQGLGEGEHRVKSFEDYGRAAFGQLGESLVLVLQALNFIGLCSAYLALIATMLFHLSGGRFDIVTWLFISSPFLTVLALLPNVTAVAKLVPLAVSAIGVMVIVVVCKSLQDAGRWQAWPDAEPSALHRMWPRSSMDMGVVVSTLLGAYAVNGNVPSVLAEMRDPHEFPFAFTVAMPLVLFIYALVIAVGYYGYGEFMQADLVASLTVFPANQEQAFSVRPELWTGYRADMLEFFLSWVLLVKLVIAFPLNLMVVFQSFQTCVYTKDLVPIGTPANAIMRLFVVAVCVFFSWCVPNFGQLFAIVFSLDCPLLQCLLPIIFTYVIRRAKGLGWPSAGRMAAHACLAAVALFVQTFGAFASIMDVVAPAVPAAAA